MEERKRHGFNPWVRKIPWRRAWQPTPIFLPEESCGQRDLAGYSPWVAKSQTQLKRLNRAQCVDMLGPLLSSEFPELQRASQIRSTDTSTAALPPSNPKLRETHLVWGAKIHQEWNSVYGRTTSCCHHGTSGNFSPVAHEIYMLSQIFAFTLKAYQFLSLFTTYCHSFITDIIIGIKLKHITNQIITQNCKGHHFWTDFPFLVRKALSVCVCLRVW